MVDWQSPVTIFSDLGALIKLIHVVDGVYLWEFICNLGFEYSLFRGRRVWRWTVALYIACRISTICQVMTDLVGLGLDRQFNCELWLIFSLSFRYLTSAIALGLYSLRTIAIYRRSKVVTAITSVVVLANFILSVYRVTKARAIWAPQAQSCLRLHTHAALLNNGVMLGSEVFFILLMTGGIYNHNSGLHAFKIMYREGLLWLIFAALMQAVPVVLLVLDLNDPMNGLFIAPAVIFTSIGATRMYRTLSDRQAGNLLDFWETSQDDMTGAIRFRRKTQLVRRTPCRSGDSASTTALQMARQACPPPQPEEHYMERFEAHDIALDDEGESMGDGNRGIAKEDDKSETAWAHAM